ncbi:hypothetical protein FRB95_014891 [Tulasnella sp. JGI-2019a]|nr:hypothetical protein FRB95_014891 [Tulasnella sp. JGI-2019a]
MSSTNHPPLLDRPDVHRSAKALELICSLFHDYCQAVSAGYATQKKLAKALKDAGNVKGTHATATNAFMSAAAMFEILAELDGKFSKVCDREYEGMSQELKKWFKKLTKEEKNHDEYAYSIQSRLKMAAQSYEKKAKPRYQDAVLDHTRYVNQLNALTNDLTQARQAHAAYVTQKHSSVVLFAGATATRWADAEWTRSCETVRKTATVIGRVGEWRAHCEGGWTGDMPGDLVDLAAETEQKLSDAGRLETLHEEADPIPHSSQRGSGSGGTSSSALTRPDLGAPGSPASSYNPDSLRPPRGPHLTPSSDSPKLAGNLTLPPQSPEITSLMSSSPMTPVFPVSSPVVKFADAISPPPPTSSNQLDSAVETSYPFPEVKDNQEKDDDPTIPRRTSPPTLEAETIAERNVTSAEQPESQPPPIPERPALPPPILKRDSASTDPSPPGGEAEQKPAETARSADEVGAAKSPRPLLPSSPPPERTRVVDRRSSIDSNLSNGSHVAAMRQKYGAVSTSQNMPTSPPVRDSARIPSISSASSPRALSNATNPSNGRLNSTPPTDRLYPRHKSVDFNNSNNSNNNSRAWEPDRSRERVFGGNNRSPPSSTRDRDRPLGMHSPRRSRDWAEEREILEDRDREGSRRRREESFDWEEKEMSLKARQRELERMAFELELEKDRLRTDKSYPSDQEDRGGVRQRQQREGGGREQAKDTEVESFAQRAAARRSVVGPPISPSPRRTYPLSTGPLGRQDTPPDLGGGKQSTSSGHASSCGCHDCSAKLYATTPRSAGAGPPSSISASSDRDRDRYNSSQTSLTGLSRHPVASPGLSKRPNSGGQRDTLAPPIQPFASVPKTEKRGVFANLRRLSMPLGGPSTNAGRVSPGGYDDRQASSLGVNAARR